MCKNHLFTFSWNRIEVDENNNQYQVPIKEQCGVKNPYVREYGLNRTYSKLICANVQNLKWTSTGWVMEINSFVYEELLQNI